MQKVITLAIMATLPSPIAQLLTVRMITASAAAAFITILLARSPSPIASSLGIQQVIEEAVFTTSANLPSLIPPSLVILLSTAKGAAYIMAVPPLYPIVPSLTILLMAAAAGFRVTVKPTSLIAPSRAIRVVSAVAYIAAALKSAT